VNKKPMTKAQAERLAERYRGAYNQNYQAYQDGTDSDKWGVAIFVTGLPDPSSDSPKENES
jgi:hypothetical protein